MEWTIEHGGDVSDELIDLQMMAEYGWSWDQLQATPLYMRNLGWYRLQMVAAAKEQAEDRARRQSGAEHA
jgi:hypothetical protein